MKICIFGNKDSTKELIEHLSNKDYFVTYLVCLDPEESKKIQISGKSSLLNDVCKKNNIKIFKTKNYSLNGLEDSNFFQQEKFDLGLCTGWQRLIPDEINNSFKYGIYGWHGSGFEFPNGRGRSPLNWSIRLGLKTIYHNCFQLASGADSGKVFETKVLKIEDSDYIFDIQKKALQHILQSSVRLIKNINEDSLLLYDQPDYPFFSFPALKESSGEIFTDKISCRSALLIIRSCSKPFPGAFFQDKFKVRIWHAQECDDKHPEMNSGKKTFIKKEILFFKVKDGWLESNDFEYC